MYPFSNKRVAATLREQGIEKSHTRDGDVYLEITLQEYAPGQVRLSEDAPTMGKIEMKTPSATQA